MSHDRMRMITPADLYAPLPMRYRGVWQRTLLKSAQRHDTTSTVFWLQTAHWHADLRIPAGRPDFTGVRGLAACTSEQLAWLARQQGFAGLTEVTQEVKEAQATPAGIAPRERCAWHRLTDFQPPEEGPDAGYMDFLPTHLLETGLDGSYLEHWSALPAAETGRGIGTAVLQRAGVPPTFLMVAGEYVMHVRSRRQPWPPGTLPGATLITTLGATLAGRGTPAQGDLLDFEISFGRRTASGWRVMHSTFPWREGLSIPMRMSWRGRDRVEITSRGAISSWQVHEWMPPV